MQIHVCSISIAAREPLLLSDKFVRRFVHEIDLRRSLEMDSEPNRWFFRLRPLDPVAFPGGNEDVIACAQRSRGRFAFEPQSGAALEHDHPLVRRLIVPESGRASLPLRYDALDLQSGPSEDFAKLLFSRAGG